MNILAIDTATEACSVALKTSDVIVARFDVCPQKHSQYLLPMVDDVLNEAGMTLDQLDLLAYGRGPGSFTGVRIATGMVQGLALGTGLPVAGVSTLAAMACQAHSETGASRVAAAIDARMGEVYFAVYSFSDSAVPQVLVEEQVCPPADALSQLAGIEQACCVGTGWHAYPELTPYAGDQKVGVLYPSAEAMLGLAQAAAASGLTTDATGVEPVYLRDKVTWKKLPGRE
ncbi:tRNA (adenosine(37)-N6)-threonylcarbamoyltransferase complex dimerization subunit type 1 TsaB [Alteromonas sp. CYL-A6]|uniref:tRNA (adenosine(37)-N6)-threonylcarbamoyltransferase complex dimerization subunit type 1 TsaB n=1 Tax=Alteromonas nitratireducens TaxID=3390813 RepID=UPI0034B1F900